MPFHRLHHESHPEVRGVGLGQLLVRTAVGEGRCVSLQLLRIESDESATDFGTEVE